MPISYSDHIFYDADHGIHFEKSYAKERSFYFHIVFGTDQFLDYQKDLFQDFLGTVIDIIESEENDFIDVKSQFEKALQDLNTKLQAFSDKIKEDITFPIK